MHERYVGVQVFQDDWLGEADPEGHVVNKGRWAYLTIKAHAPVRAAHPAYSRVEEHVYVIEQTQTHNVYGLLRSPWNANPSPYVTRYLWL
jgi:hypothetical protein